MRYLVILFLPIVILVGCTTTKQFTSYLEENKMYVSDRMYDTSEDVKIEYDFRQEGNTVKNIEKSCLPLFFYWEMKNVIDYGLDSSYYQNAIYNGVYRGVEELRLTHDVKHIKISFQKVTRKFQYYLHDKTYYFILGYSTSSIHSDLPINEEELVNKLTIEIVLNNGEKIHKKVESEFQLMDENWSRTEIRTKRSIETMLTNYEKQMENVAYNAIVNVKKLL